MKTESFYYYYYYSYEHVATLATLMMHIDSRHKIGHVGE
jgi:hypothetical protein